MSYLTFAIVVPIVMLLGTGYLHIRNLRDLYKKFEKSVSKEELYREITVAQGSNFTALAMAAWIMLFVSVAFRYLLIPSELPYSYMMQIPEWASNPLGFFIFGIIVALFVTIIFLISDNLPENHRNLKLTELYSFYPLSKNMKKYISLTSPLLGFSIILSIWMATIYPEYNLTLEVLSFVPIVISMIVLFWPIWVGYK